LPAPFGPAMTMQSGFFVDALAIYESFHRDDSTGRFRAF
jgi:hypothetical protein